MPRSKMQKNDLISHLQDMTARHKSLFLLGKSYIDELSDDNKFFTEEERQRIRELLELVVQDIIEQRSIISDLLQNMTEGKEDAIY